MPTVSITIHDHAFDVACGDGDEDHLKVLARMLGDKVGQLSNSLGQVGESRLLLLAGLMLADELIEQKGGKKGVETIDTRGARQLDTLTQQIENIVAGLETS